MVEADPVMRAARNAFLVVIVLLLGVSVYQFLTIGIVSRPIGLLWVAGVLAFYGSKYYYQRQIESTTSDSEAESDL